MKFSIAIRVLKLNKELINFVKEVMPNVREDERWNFKRRKI